MKKLLIFAIMLLSAYQAIAADSIGTYTVTAEALNIRDAPDGKVIGKLTRTTCFPCTKLKNLGPVLALTANLQNGFLAHRCVKQAAVTPAHPHRQLHVLAM